MASLLCTGLKNQWPARRPPLEVTGCDQNAYLKERKKEKEEGREGLHRIVCKLQSASAADTKMLGAGNLFPVTGLLCHLGG